MVPYTNPISRPVFSDKYMALPCDSLPSAYKDVPSQPQAGTS